MVCGPVPFAEVGVALWVKFQFKVVQFNELVPLKVTVFPAQMVRLLAVIWGCGPAKVPPFGLLLLKVNVNPVLAEKLLTSKA